MSKVYLVKNEVGRYKIGISGDVSRRIKTLRYSGGLEIDIMATWYTAYASTFEEFLHTKYNKFHHFGEWFNIPYDPLDEISALHQKFEEVTLSVCGNYDNGMHSFTIAQKMHQLLPPNSVSHKRSMRLQEAKLHTQRSIINESRH